MKKIFQRTSNKIERLLQHSRYLDYLSKRLLTYLPKEFSGKVSVLGFSAKGKKNSLIVAVVNPAWGSKLRFYTPTLRRSLCAEPQFSQLERIIIRVSASKLSLSELNAIEHLNAKEQPIYSKNSAQTIINSAEHIDNKDLKKALMQLSAHVERQY